MLLPHKTSVTAALFCLGKSWEAAGSHGRKRQSKVFVTVCQVLARSSLGDTNKAQAGRSSLRSTKVTVLIAAIRFPPKTPSPRSTYQPLLGADFQHFRDWFSADNKSEHIVLVPFFFFMCRWSPSVTETDVVGTKDWNIPSWAKVSLNTKHVFFWTNTLLYSLALLLFQ